MRNHVVSTAQWLSAEQVALHLDVAPDTGWRERKGLSARKIGRLWRFQLSAVYEWGRASGADED